MKPVDILREFYDPSSFTFKMLLIHGRAVAAKALAIANSLPALTPDTAFIEEAALLHDIGIFLTHTPGLGCTGVHPYVCHGYLGRKLLERKGLFRHALVCERHVGVGISAADIDGMHLPLPRRDMRPVTIEEEIICYADKFFSKSETSNGKEKSTAEILAGLAPYGRDKVNQFLSWIDRFGNPKVSKNPMQSESD
ncbi:MAG: HD domain-containing protein [Pseudomonadota bacterium]